MADNGKKIEEFWEWFDGIARTLAADVENPSLLDELDARIHQLDPKLSWEIGPGSHASWQFIISPNLDIDLRDRAREIVARAPVVEDWEFHPARRPKNWDYKLVMETATGERLELDVSGWKFVLLQYPDGTREILLQANNLSTLDDEERWQAAAIVLESILGEEPLMGQIRQFELMEQLEPRFAEKQKPIQHLRDVVFGTSS